MPGKQNNEEREQACKQHSNAVIKPLSIPKIPTGITGLDETLQGGFPEACTTLIRGAAGTGKTLLGLEFLVHSAMENKPIIFISFEETGHGIRRNASAMGWNLAALEKDGLFTLWEPKLDWRAATSGSFNIDGMLGIIKGLARQSGARILMIDALDVLLFLFENPDAIRNEMYRLHDWLIENRFTVVLTAKANNGSPSARSYEFLDYLADCVLHLDFRVQNQLARRRLRIVKYRGSGFYSNEYPYMITEKGNVILPVTGLGMNYTISDTLLTSGCEALDRALGGGGYRKGTSLLITGPPGIGKTTLSALFTRESCTQNQRVLYINFEESPETLIANMQSPGIDLRPAFKKGLLRIHSIMPEALGSETHLFAIFGLTEAFEPDHLIVDTISALNRMGAGEAVHDFLVRLIHFCKKRSITCLLTHQTSMKNQVLDPDQHGIYSILDTILNLDYQNASGRLLRTLIVLKSRGVHHSNASHVMEISNHGVDLRQEGDCG